MPTLNLKNISIKKLQDKNFNDYFLIVNNDNQEVYFCFSGAVKEGWQDLTTNHETIKEVEIEYETTERGNNRVISLYAVKEDDITFL